MRRFGIELELVGPTAARGNALNHAARIIDTLGFPHRTNSHFGTAYSVWQCKPDVSIEPRDRSVEVVSPIMPARPDSYDTIQRVVTALDEQGYGINRSCGFHVHVNVSDLSMVERQLVVLWYAHHQAEINRMVPPSRRSNNFCQALGDRRGLELAINNRDSSWRRHMGRVYEAVNTAFLHESDARLEFRQAAGTCNANKVVGWVKFLQEFIDEIVRRARNPEIVVGTGRPQTTPAPQVVRPPLLTPAGRNPLAQVPRMREGSDAHRALMQLCNNGVVTTAWAETNGIGRHVLRRIIVGFRRHGAALNTVSTSVSGPNYVLQGTHALPTRPRDIFTGAPQAEPVAAPVVAPAPVPTPVAPVVGPRTVAAAEFVAYPLTTGLSVGVAAWVSDRFDTFNADQPA